LYEEAVTPESAKDSGRYLLIPSSGVTQPQNETLSQASVVLKSMGAKLRLRLIESAAEYLPEARWQRCRGDSAKSEERSIISHQLNVMKAFGVHPSQDLVLAMNDRSGYQEGRR